MKVKLLTGLAGIDFVHNPGDEIEVSGEVAKRMIDRGIAEAVAEPKRRAKKVPDVELTIEDDGSIEER